MTHYLYPFNQSSIKSMIEEIQEKYKAQFQGEAILIKAPGRINLIGEHTDYNKGLVMPAAIDKAMYFAFGKRKDQQEVFIQSVNYGEWITLGKKEAREIPSWARYLEAILVILRERGEKVQGINCVFGGDIPIGAGLSSSAALCCGFIYGLASLLDLQFSRREIALIAQEAEHRIGLHCGLMDQYAVLFGKKEQVFCLDCENLELQYFPIHLEQHSLVLINSKIEHELEGSPYNDRRRSCEQVVETIATKYPGLGSLRAVTMTMLREFETSIAPLDFQRAKYVLEENERVRQMMKALIAGKLEEAGAILLRGHQGMSEEYDVSLPEINLLVSLAKAEKSILGARMMGGGFGGCTINLIENKNKTASLQRIKSAYFEATAIEPEIYTVKIGDGLTWIK